MEIDETLIADALRVLREGMKKREEHEGGISERVLRTVLRRSAEHIFQTDFYSVNFYTWKMEKWRPDDPKSIRTFIQEVLSKIIQEGDPSSTTWEATWGLPHAIIRRKWYEGEAVLVLFDWRGVYHY